MEHLSEASPTRNPELDAQVFLERFLGAAFLKRGDGVEELQTIRDELKQANEESVETSVAFVKAMQDSSLNKTVGTSALGWGGCATRFSLDITLHDREAGLRLVHSFLTYPNPRVTDGSWQEIQRWYKRGDLPYDDYQGLFVVRSLVATRRR